jgi:hypothetical protein
MINRCSERQNPGHSASRTNPPAGTPEQRRFEQCV